MREFRVCWEASSNASFRGNTDWEPWDQSDDEDIAAALSSTDSAPICTPDGLDMALEASGFNWWTEVRWNDDE